MTRRPGNISKHSLYQLIAKASLDVFNVSKDYMTKIIIVETLYATSKLTENPLHLSNLSKAFAFQLITKGSLDVSNKVQGRDGLDHCRQDPEQGEHEAGLRELLALTCLLACCKQTGM